MNLAISRGIELCVGSGTYRFCLSIHGQHDFLLRVPLIGKAWSYGPGYSGRMGWSGVRAEHAQGLED